MAAWLKLLIFILVIGVSRAHHIKLLVLALLGLAGLWMFQTQSGGGGGGKGINLGSLFPNLNPASIATRIFSKRSIPDFEFTSTIGPNPELKNIDWDKILLNDPSTCARSFICQLAATTENELTAEETAMINLIRLSRNAEIITNDSNKELFIAMKNGEKFKNQKLCRKIYKKCPYSSKTMITLLKFFGSHNK